MRFISLTFIIFFLLVSANALASDIQHQRLLYLDAEKYIKNGNMSRFSSNKNQLIDYPLYPYLVYLELRKNIYHVDHDAVRLFFYKYGETPVADKLRRKYLHVLARRQKWQDFVHFYKDSSDTKLECLYRKALYKVGNHSQAIYNVEDIWLTGKSLPSACDFILKTAMNEEVISSELLIERLKLAVDKRNIRLAYYLSGKLTNSEELKSRIRNSHHFPIKFLDATTLQTATDLEKFLYSHAMIQLARKDLELALNYWGDTNKNLLVKNDVISVERRLSYEAYRQRSEPPKRMVAFSTEHSDRSTLASLFRLNLSHKNWSQVLKNIDQFDHEDASAEEWLYWRARSMERLGNYIQAYRIYDDISSNRSFYGFLSADKLHKPYKMNLETVEYEPKELQIIEKNPYYLRAYELYKLGRPADSRREFLYMISHFDDEELNKAAFVAHHNGWHDVAILTMAKGQNYDDLKIRFPVIEFENEDSIVVDKAWLLALIRQESIFMHDAMSHRGALGLMQIMPKTANYIARLSKLKIGNSRYRISKQELLNKENNVLLGSHYLSRNMEMFNDNPVLATAAYNAGPYNVKKWLPDNRLDADIWIETIPFNETRDYVQRVLTYTSIYEKKLGIKDRKMTDRMPDIISKPNY
ncbi:MAG: transglycosylase SLT domain-containing protein [Gammaproteobacteria bacterium]|nr:transglycosylase SLT domain-containing protein [Gammaproteobacteria bacterium]